jgi:hypothetical protein
MAHEYCNCDAKMTNGVCDCSGITSCADCPVYTSGDVYSYITANNTHPPSCSTDYYVPVDSAYESSDITTLKNLISNNFVTGKIIYASDILTLWEKFENLYDKKKEAMHSGSLPTPPNSKPSTEIQSGKVIKAAHLDNLKDNLDTIVGPDGSALLADGTGSGFDDPVSGNTISIKTQLNSYNIYPGNIIKAEDAHKIAQWIGAAMYFCVCNNNAPVQCCACHIVCDCNYSD